MKSVANATGSSRNTVSQFFCPSSGEVSKSLKRVETEMKRLTKMDEKNTTLYEEYVALKYKTYDLYFDNLFNHTSCHDLYKEYVTFYSYIFDNLRSMNPGQQFKDYDSNGKKRRKFIQQEDLNLCRFIKYTLNIQTSSDFSANLGVYMEKYDMYNYTEEPEESEYSWE